MYKPAFLCGCAVLALAQRNVWTTYVDPQNLLKEYQPKYQISKLIVGLYDSWQIILPNDDACIAPDQGILRLYRSSSPKPCSVNVADSAVAVSDMQASAWRMTAQLNSTLDCCTNVSSTLYCNTSHASAFRIRQSGTCESSVWRQTDYNPPWALNGGRTHFLAPYQIDSGIILIGGRNASSGQSLMDTWVQCSMGCSPDEWTKGGDIPSGCDPLDLSTFQMAYRTYLVCPEPITGVFRVIGFDSTFSRWVSVPLVVPPAPALPPVRYQSTQFSELPYNSPLQDMAAHRERSAVLGTEPKSALMSSGACIVAVTGGPGVLTPGNKTIIHRSVDGLHWDAFNTAIPTRTRAGIAGFTMPGRAIQGIVIAGGIGEDGSYLGDAYTLSGEFCCASSCDDQGVCSICNDHGVCSLINQVCECEPDWTGNFCTTRVPSPTPSSTSQPSLLPGLSLAAATAVLVICSVAVVFVLAGAAWRVRAARIRTPGVPRSSAVINVVRDFR